MKKLNSGSQPISILESSQTPSSLFNIECILNPIHKMGTFVQT